MSGYFDALIRSSGMTIGRERPALTAAEPAALEVGFDGSTTSTEPRAMRSASTPHEPLVPLHPSGPMELAEPSRPQGRVERHAHEEPERAPAPARDARRGAVHSAQALSVPVESAPSDPGHTLVRAAMRWVAAGTPQIEPNRGVDPREIASGVRRQRHSVSAGPEDRGTIATTTLHRNDDDTKVQSLKGAAEIPAPLKVPAGKSAEKPVPIQASLVPAVPPALVAPPAHDEVVEVSIGAIHVRVDAPQAQTVARPALTPGASAADAATSRPARSALSRRALRRI